MTAQWWKCAGSSETLPELAPCDVLTVSPEQAAIEYARGAHESIAPEDATCVVEVWVQPEHGGGESWTFKITTTRAYRAESVLVEHETPEEASDAAAYGAPPAYPDLDPRYER